ncbi:MAG: hypothetical protein WAN61_02945 [Minisyncoccia bacterium]
MLDNEDIKKLTSILATKSDFDALKSEVKSFRNETRESLAELNEKIDDLTTVVMSNHDKRIEALEEKAGLSLVME